MNPNYQSYESITHAILGFAAYARAHELNVGIRETQEALSIAATGLIREQEFFRYALKSVFCNSEENAVLFDQLFADYWGAPKASVTSRITMKNQSNLQKQMQRSLVLLGKGENKDGQEEEGKNVSGANAAEQLRKTDFSKLSEIDSEYLEKLATNLWKQMSRRLKKKLKTSTTKGKIDIRQTIRNNIGSGGAMLELKLKLKKPTRNRLVILLDVSGSMDKYSFFLLRFILALRAHFQKIEAFIFSTKLIRITEFLKIKNLDHVLIQLSTHTDNWSSGTKIGDCLKSFNDDFCKRALQGRSMTIILSDGLDTGEPELLANELHKIKRRTRKLIWLNPLKGMDGYQPLARGMSAALPEIDVFRSAHSLDSILELENYLADV
ncbi:MAG: VWA domain-containing protein [Bacteroidota bacterium]